MEPRKAVRIVAIEFANWIDTACIKGMEGYLIVDDESKLREFDATEYPVDELYDYWFENIYFPSLKAK